MRKEVMKKWVRALRSGKYKQGESFLKCDWTRKGTRHCCLGVLCELYNNNMKKNKKKTIPETTKDSGVHKFGRSDSLLPNVVKKWAGMKSNEGAFKDQYGMLTSLTDVNDFGDSFKKIATIIEKNWETL